MAIRLDLTAASRVHLLEPQWSPMAEEQALDRVHRMGQRQEVVATRYIVKDSIEEVRKASLIPSISLSFLIDVGLLACGARTEKQV